MNYSDYRIKLGIGFSDDQKFVALKNKILNFIDFLYRASPSTSFDYTYTDHLLFMTSIGEKIDEDNDDDLYELKLVFEDTQSVADLISKYIEFCNCYNHNHRSSPNSDLLFILKKHLHELGVQFEIYEDSDGKYIFPKGVKELDSALVSEPLQWLSSYPSAEKAWGNALRDYAECRPDKASDVADKLRKALETFFKEFFGNDKTLENNKAEYGRYLKAQGVPAEISNNLETLLLAYTNFMNAYAKHHDKTEQKVLEYLMYQTGNIMRLLITLKAEETSNAD